MNYEEICKEVIKIAKETGRYLREEKNKFSRDKIESKGLHDFVSYVDKQSEKELVIKLSKLIPEAGFIAEEGTSTKTGDTYNWIIDPLDGTTNFIHNIYPFAISIALKENDNIVIGVIYEIGLDEMFYAWKNGKAYLNETEIHVSETSKLKDCFIATGFPYYDFERIDGFMESMKYFMENTPGLRRLGSAATDLAYVACGRFDAFYEYSLSPWDVAAGAFIVQQAGGKVSDFSGGNTYLFGKEILASNASIFLPFLTKISEFMKTKTQNRP